MKLAPIAVSVLALLLLSLPACDKKEAAEGEGHERQSIVTTSPLVKDMVVTQPFVCQIHSRRHTEIRALQSGYLKPIKLKEGHAVNKGDVLYEINPVLYQARYDAEVAEVNHAELEYKYTKTLADNPAKVVSQNELLLYGTKLARAKAKLGLAKAELDFCTVYAPFDGIVDRQMQQQGSLVKENDILTTLSDNRVLWVYFNVPEARYFEYMAEKDHDEETQRIELVLADGKPFPHPGSINAIEAQFDNKTGNIKFRADFPNPTGLLRHGQTGTVMLHRTMKDAVVVPQRATFEFLDKLYVYVVDQEHTVHQRRVTVRHEIEDIFILGNEIGPDDKIVLEGIREVHDGQKDVHAEFRKPQDALKNVKQHAE